VTYPNVGFTHQGWFTEDERYFFLDDEVGPADGENTRTIVFDLNDLDDPVVLTVYTAKTTATAHNLYIRGHYMYQGNYTAGFRVVDVADPKNPKEVGFLDTAPDLDGPGMTLGAWGTYPFFKDNVVAVASRGLFLVRLKTP
jgi:choice-of-anchor B domain-containing protein